MLLSICRRRKVNSHGHPSHDPSQSSNIGGAHRFVEPSPHIGVFALIIGINKYKSSRISNLVGAVPDADAMRDYLQNHLRVPSYQIKNLRNSEATRAAIIDGIKAFSLNDEIKEGDPILIYFAGHGGSANTPKDWEAGSTGKIELLVPYDHSSLVGGNPKHGIPDRTLGALLSQLAIEKGNNITVILDCCHSGSGTRNPDPTFMARAIDVGDIPSNLDEDIWSVFESSKGSGRGTEIYSGFARKGLRSHILLAACRPQELAYERTSRGVFTVALLKTLMKIGIDKLTYATLFDHWMPPLSSGQSPQCEGVFRERSIFNGMASDKRTAGGLYKIHKSKGETYVIDAGEAAGITVGAEFEVYQDQNFTRDDFLGIVVAHELSAFSTTLLAKEFGFSLERDGFALSAHAGTKERVQIHVTDRSLINLVKNIDPSQRIIQLAGRYEAEFGIALENGKVVFNIYDSEATKYGLTRMPYILEPTIEAISPVILAAAHFYWHRRRSVQTDCGILAEKVKIEGTKLKLIRTEYDDELKPVGVYSPTESGRESGKVFHVQTGKPYGWKIINNCKMPLYPALFYFDNSDWSITPYYVPPIARGIVEHPLKGEGFLTVGYGDSGSVPHKFFLRKGQNVDVGILKLFLSRKQVNLSHVAQSSPFKDVSSGSRGSTEAVLPEPKNLHLPWDTIEIPLVQQRADKHRRY